MRRVGLSFAAALLLLVGCRQGTVKQVEPELGLGAPTLDFGVRKVGVAATSSVELLARTQADVQLTASLSGDADFSVSAPSSLAGLETVALLITFTPSSAGSRSAVLTLRSNDPRNPMQTLALSGTGAEPQVTVTVGCDAGCVVTQTPPAAARGLAAAVRHDSQHRARPRHRLGVALGPRRAGLQPGGAAADGARARRHRDAAAALRSATAGEHAVHRDARGAD
ncbi:MAG: choice-of-anchor D domain-containing protein [Myxococcales bacterium]|nr:choice-of-anchor D domain-containing protein [Myxococcales bacterium]